MNFRRAEFELEVVTDDFGVEATGSLIVRNPPQSVGDGWASHMIEIVPPGGKAFVIDSGELIEAVKKLASVSTPL